MASSASSSTTTPSVPQYKHILDRQAMSRFSQEAPESLDLQKCQFIMSTLSGLPSSLHSLSISSPTFVGVLKRLSLINQGLCHLFGVTDRRSCMDTGDIEQIAKDCPHLVHLKLTPITVETVALQVLGRFQRLESLDLDLRGEYFEYQGFSSEDFARFLERLPATLSNLRLKSDDWQRPERRPFTLERDLTAGSLKGLQQLRLKDLPQLDEATLTRMTAGAEQLVDIDIRGASPAVTYRFITENLPLLRQLQRLHLQTDYSVKDDKGWTTTAPALSWECLDRIVSEGTELRSLTLNLKMKGDPDAHTQTKGNLPKLQHLNLYADDQWLRAEVQGVLLATQQLRTLKLRWSGACKDDAVFTAKVSAALASLEELECGPCSDGLAGLGHLLREAKGLRRLTMNGWREKQDIPWLTDGPEFTMGALEDLVVSWQKMSSKDLLTLLSRMPKLRNLDLRSIEFVGGESQLQLPSQLLAQLESLTFSMDANDNIQETHVDLTEILVNGRRLRQLWLAGSIFANRPAMTLSWKPGTQPVAPIRMLELEKIEGLSWEELAELLSSLPQLEELHLSKLPDLKRSSPENPLFDPKRPLPSLRELKISTCKHLPSDFVESLKAAAPQLKKLEVC